MIFCHNQQSTTHKCKKKKGYVQDSDHMITATSFSCCSDDSDDSDGELGAGLSLDTSPQHPALTVKSEPCEQGDGLPDVKPLNGVLLQGKGKTDFRSTFIYAQVHFLMFVC